MSGVSPISCLVSHHDKIWKTVSTEACRGHAKCEIGDKKMRDANSKMREEKSDLRVGKYEIKFERS